ncbi:MAG: ABC transporter substrate-binding protein [bacterium]
MMSKKWKTLGAVGLILGSLLAVERGWSASPFQISHPLRGYPGFRIFNPAIPATHEVGVPSDSWEVKSLSSEEVINLPAGVTCVKIADTQSAILPGTQEVGAPSAIWYCTTSVTVVADTTATDTRAVNALTPDTSSQAITSDTIPSSPIADTTGADTTFVSVAPDTSPPSAIPGTQEVGAPLVDDPGTTIKKLIATIRLKDHDRFRTFMDPEKQCRLSLGKYWEKASAKQRKEYLNYYTPVLTAFSISGAQRYFKDIEINYGKAVVTDEGATVPTTIIYKNQREIHIDYRLTLYSNGWKAYDVLIDNESLIDDYRKQYEEFLKNKTFDDLIRVIKDLHKIHVTTQANRLKAED